MKRIDLNGGWEFKAVGAKRALPTEHADVQQWMPASVPGTVHTDLLAAGRIPDPFVRMNELDVQWIDKCRWRYRRQFEVAPEILEEDSVVLVAEGLDTYARITLNGHVIGETANMFVEHRFNVKRFLKRGKNVLEVLFDSPTVRPKQLEQKHGTLGVALEPHRVYVRKAQYSFGWDWGPKLTTSGIWRNINLEAFTHCLIRSVFVRTERLTKRNAVVRIELELDRLTKVPVDVSLTLSGEGFEHIRFAKMRGKKKVVRMNIPTPRLWWPNGYGDQPLYRVHVAAAIGESERDSKTASFGIRTVRLLQETDDEGRSFVVEVNGKKIFCKGADWIPTDSFIPRIQPEKYERLLTLARDAHMNMIRVWGGGVYESDLFYDLCDRLGLMVWQDFMFACGEYPQQRWFMENVRDEATKVIERLRNHPSLTVWCGNNECEWLFCADHPDASPDDMRGAPIFRDLLPSLCRLLDGSRPYWRSSPFGKGFPNAESNGNHHQWMVWSAWKDFSEFDRNTARFVTEFGFQAPAHKRTFQEISNAEDRDIQSPVMEHHNKQTEGTERLVRFQTAHFKLTTDFEQFMYQGQLVQAEALKHAVEHWRRRKFKTAGALFWQFNDCWPVSSWSVIDSALRPKAAYYFAKRFFAPILISMKRGSDGVEVWCVNDHLQSVVGTLTVRLLTFEGNEIATMNREVTLKANASVKLLHLDPKSFSGFDRTSSYLVATIRVENEVRSENRIFFAESKHLVLPQPSIEVKVEQICAGEYRLRLTSATLARAVRVEVDGEDAVFSDNYVDIDPHGEQVILCATRLTEHELQARLRLKSLGDSTPEVHSKWQADRVKGAL